jgi:hypothetical protein
MARWNWKKKYSAKPVIGKNAAIKSNLPEEAGLKNKQQRKRLFKGEHA